MTIEQVIAEENKAHKEYEAKTVGAKVGGQDYTIAELRGVFDAVADVHNWKNPCGAFVSHRIVGVVCAALEFFHGSKAQIGGIQPITGKVFVSSPGYAG
jgi:hypothetical protein